MGYHRNIIGKILERLRSFLGHFYGNFMEIICLKAPGSYSVPLWSYNFSLCLWERRKTIIFMISGLSDVSLAPQTNYFYLWSHQDT